MAGSGRPRSRPADSRCRSRPGSGRTEPDEVARLVTDVVGAALLRNPVPKLQDQVGAGLWSARAEFYPGR